MGGFDTLVRVRIHARTDRPYHSAPTKWEKGEVRLAAEQSNKMHHLGVKIYSSGVAASMKVAFHKMVPSPEDPRRRALPESTQRD